jgi:hypothetical protein
MPYNELKQWTRKSALVKNCVHDDVLENMMVVTEGSFTVIFDGIVWFVRQIFYHLRELCSYSQRSPKPTGICDGYYTTPPD